ncbi:GHKL domain-containing protein [Legionella israelensis]|uniref:sensor histidine kinase n=1 Tax=Legionella israelensis TaxID=454 RepID=UPI00117F3B1C|nr:ATP-binding protein [Legionella israelensis]QDP73248.1 GHKL domain-containing protein [Legionella israelensis]
MASIMEKVLLNIGIINPYRLSEKIRARQVQLLYEQLTDFTLISESLAATGLCIALWNVANHTLLIVWLLFMCLVSGVGRKILTHFYFNHQKNLSNDAWIKLFAISVFFSGSAWGFVGGFLMPNEGIVYQTFAMILIFGVTAAANNLYSPVLVIYILYLVLAFVPLSVWFFLQGGLYNLLGFMSFLYIGVMINTAYHTNKLLITSLRLGFKNLDLALAEKKLNDQLIIASRRAGMADIATSVLHNIGNVLVSVNTSIGMMDKKITSSKLSNLEGLSRLLQEHKEDMGTFMTTDPKGQRLPNYLSTLSTIWLNDKNYLLKELRSLDTNIAHIKDVISKQNALSTSFDIRQEVIATELLEDALTLNQLSYEQAGINIIREFSSIKKINIDRVKLLQIIVNLIKNSIESLVEANIANKKIILRIYEQNNSFLVIEVADNGTGILPDNMKRIFQQGFTTKKKGHGFGLHSSALAAQEMHGSLSVKSDGAGKGATFILRLPYYQHG